MPADVVESFRVDAAELPSDAVIFGGTAAMREIHDQLQRVLHNDLPVLIRGESGTGKEVIARYLHARSSRRTLPFVKVNCAAIPENVMESLFLGSTDAGAAGACGAARGLLEMAAGGTLFLDEIGDLKWAFQTKLLDLLEDSETAGGGWHRRTRARIICSTNSDLERAIEKRAFREDLFYRIEVIHLRLAPLRDRKDDIPQLCEHFREKLSKRFGKTAPPLTQDILHRLQEWSWPGNVRELENWIAREIILGSGAAHAPAANGKKAVARSQALGRLRSAKLTETRRHSAPTSRSALIKALQANRGNRRKTAEDLKISYSALLGRLREAGVPGRRKNHRGTPPEP
jgi:DNA-binding NtrC family response regulator